MGIWLPLQATVIPLAVWYLCAGNLVLPSVDQGMTGNAEKLWSFGGMCAHTAVLCFLSSCSGLLLEHSSTPGVGEKVVSLPDLGDVWIVWRHCGWSQQEQEGAMASRGWRPGTLLDVHSAQKGPLT